MGAAEFSHHGRNSGFLAVSRQFPAAEWHHHKSAGNYLLGQRVVPQVKPRYCGAVGHDPCDLLCSTSETLRPVLYNAPNITSP